MKNLQSVRAMIVLLVVMNGSHLLWAAAPIKLNAPLVAGGDTAGVRISPDGSRVLYRADQDTDEVDEIYSVPITGGAPVKLNGPLAVGGDVEGFLSGLQFSPDGARVLYVADQDTDGVVEIYSVPSGGGMPVKLNGPLVAFGNVDCFADNQFSPISSRVLYLADEDTSGVDELYSVLSTGGGQLKVNGPLVAGGDVDDSGFQFSSGAARILYRADQDTNDVFELYSVTGGGAPVKLNGALVAGGDVAVSSFMFRPDGVRVVYRADQITDEVFEIFSVPSGGGVPVKLNGALVAGGDVGRLEISPDSTRVLYRADQDADEVFELFSVPSGGGAAVKLNGPLVAGGDASFSIASDQASFSPNSSRVLYRADQFTDEVFELFSVPAGGGVPVKLNGPLAAGGDVGTGGFKFSPDSSRVLYVADQITVGLTELFSVASTGGTPVKLNGPLTAGGLSGTAEFSPDGSRVLYLGNQVDSGLGLYLVPSAGGTTVHHTSGATPVRVSGPLVAGGSFLSPGGSRFSPDGSVIVYTADQDTDDVFEIYARIVRLHTVGAGGSWDAGSTWDHGVVPDDVMQVFIDGSTSVTATGSATPRSANALQVGNGAGSATLTLASNAVITAVNGVLIDNGGTVRGDGQIVGDVAIGPLGELRASSNEQLRITGDVLNEGSIVASGLPGAPAEIEFDGNTENFDSIAARFAVLRFNAGLYSENDLTFVSGSSEVFGDVNNQGTSTSATTRSLRFTTTSIKMPHCASTNLAPTRAWPCSSAPSPARAAAPAAATSSSTATSVLATVRQ